MGDQRLARRLAGAAWAAPSARSDRRRARSRRSCGIPAAGCSAAASPSADLSDANGGSRAQVPPGDQLGDDADGDLGDGLRADVETRPGPSTRARSASAIPGSRRLSKISRILRRLPIRPTYGAGVGAR